MSNLDNLRREIEEIDNELRKLFIKRMEVSVKIGNYKKDNNLPVLDQIREDELILKYEKLLNDHKMWPYYKEFILNIMKISKEIQNG